MFKLRSWMICGLCVALVAAGDDVTAAQKPAVKRKKAMDLAYVAFWRAKLAADKQYQSDLEDYIKSLGNHVDLTPFQASTFKAQRDIDDDQKAIKEKAPVFPAAATTEPAGK